MANPNPLNQAVISQALMALRLGLFQQLKSMGFTALEIEALKRPALVSILANSSVVWCEVKPNHDVLGRLLNHIHAIEPSVPIIDRMLRLGASSEMIHYFYGLHRPEVAVRREVVGMPGHRGRPKVIGEETENRLWERWQEAITKKPPQTNDETVNIMIEIAEAEHVTLDKVWSVVSDYFVEEDT